MTGAGHRRGSIRLGSIRRGSAALVALSLLAVVLGGGACVGSGPTAGDVGDVGGAEGAEAAIPARPPASRGPGLTAAERTELDEAVAAFLARPSAAGAGPVVELMGRSGELRYAPWLLDLVQLGLSNLLGQQIVAVLARLTGDEPSGRTFADFARMGGLIETWGVDPGPGYREWKLGLFAELDPGYRPLLDSVTDDDRLARIRYGGVNRGGIPELNRPARISAEAAGEWIIDDELVLGVDIDGEAVAYPFRIVGHHELVNDEVAGTPIALAYCTLCRTGLLFDRRVAGRVLEFETSGLLLNSNKVMVDRQTDTLWQHAAGLAIGGELEGTALDPLPLETTTWAEWLADHPTTEVLDRPAPIFFDDPERPPIAYRYQPGVPYASYYDSAETLFPVRRPPDTFAPKDEVIGVALVDGALAVSLEAVAGGPPRFFPVGRGAVVVVATGRGARVYDASGSSLVGTGTGAGEVVEVADTGGEEAILAGGDRLPRLVAEQGFWFSWWDRFPDTAVWPAP